MPKIFKNRKKIFIACFVCVFTLCLVVANILASSLISANKNTYEVKSSSFDLYMICLGKSQVKKEVEGMQEEYQKIGAGGYVWSQEGYYYLVSSAYLNKNDGVLVQNSIKNKGIDSQLISQNFPSLSIMGDFSDEESSVMSKALNIFQDYYHELYDIAISYDTSVYNEISTRLAVNNAHSNLSSKIANFETLFGDIQDDQLQKLGDALSKTLSISKKLCSGVPLNSSQTYSSLIKYHYLEILDVYRTLL